MADTSFWQSAANYVRHAVERRINTQRFIVADKTTHQVLYRDGLMELRYYPHQDDSPFLLDGDTITPQPRQHRIPLLLVPPLGVFHWVYDLMAERSWVRFLNAKGFQVYLVSWGAPGFKDAHLSLDTYINRWMVAAVERTQAHSGQQELSIVGYCMGGLMSLLYTGAHDQGQVRNLVTIASPVDFHATRIGPLLGLLRTGTRLLPMRLLDLPAEKFHVPGDALSVLFKLTNPLAGVVSYFDLLRNLSDRDYVKAHLTTREWFNNMPDYPGATVQQLVLDFAVMNKLARGQVRIGERESDLTRINSNLLAFAGKTDRLVSAAAARRLMELVQSRDRTFRIVPGGHAGVFAGGKAQDHTWAITADWLALRSD